MIILKIVLKVMFSAHAWTQTHAQNGNIYLHFQHSFYDANEQDPPTLDLEGMLGPLLLSHRWFAVQPQLSWYAHIIFMHVWLNTHALSQCRRRRLIGIVPEALTPFARGHDALRVISGFHHQYCSQLYFDWSIFRRQLHLFFSSSSKSKKRT